VAKIALRERSPSSGGAYYAN